MISYPVTLFLILSTLALSAVAFRNKAIFAACIFYPAAVRRGKNLHSLLSSGFVHLNYPHLLINMLILYYFGSELESAYFIKRENSYILFPLYYLLSILITNSILLLLRSHNILFRTTGCSAALHSVIAAYLVIWPSGHIPAFPFRLPNISVLLIYILGSLVLLLIQKKPRIDHLSHLLGLLTGIVLICTIWPDRFSEARIALEHLASQ